MANAIDVLANLVREELPSVIHESLPEIAPVYNYIKTTALGVERSAGIGHGWQVEWLFNTGVAGLIQPVSPAGPSMRANTQYPGSEFLTPYNASTNMTMNIFPDATVAPHVSSIKRILSLQKTVGNFSIPITWKQGDALDASQIGQVARDIKAVGQLRALTEATSFFMASNNTLCGVNGGACTGHTSLSNALAGTAATFTDSAAITHLKFAPYAGTGNIQFFRVGMMVDLLHDAGGTTATTLTTPVFGVGGTGLINDTSTGSAWGSTYVPLVVAAVDYINGTVVLSTMASTVHLDHTNIDGGAAWEADTMSFWVVMAGGSGAVATVYGHEMRSWGIEDWIADSGSILKRADSASNYNYLGTTTAEGIDLNTYPQFRSVVAAVNAPLTEDILNRYVGGFLNAYPGATLDTLITTMGVTMKFLQQPSQYNNRMNYDRSGKTLNFAAGWDEVSYSFNGKTMRWITAPMAIAGRMYGQKFNGDNIKRFAPPKVGGSSDQVADVEFLAPLGGHNSIFMIARNSGGLTDVLEAPYWQYCLTAPVDVRGVKLTGLTEATFTAA
jgi:hypothetical protein